MGHSAAGQRPGSVEVVPHLCQDPLGHEVRVHVDESGQPEPLPEPHLGDLGAVDPPLTPRPPRAVHRRSQNSPSCTPPPPLRPSARSPRPRSARPAPTRSSAAYPPRRPAPPRKMQIGPGRGDQLPATTPPATSSLTDTARRAGARRARTPRRDRRPGRAPAPATRASRVSSSPPGRAAPRPPGPARRPRQRARTARLSAYGIRSGTPSAARSSSSVRRAAISGPRPSQLKTTAPCSSSRAGPAPRR